MRRILGILLVIAAAVTMLGFTNIPTTNNVSVYYYSNNGSDTVSSQDDLDLMMTSLLSTGKKQAAFALGGQLTLDLDAMSDRYVIPSIQVNCIEKDGVTKVNMTTTPFPGYRLAYAYKSGDYSVLNSDELPVFHQAQEFVETVIDPDMSCEEKIALIAEYISASASYYTEPMRYDSGLRSYQTVFGTLSDGSANCMGYADAFLLLGSMAGLDVSMQSGYLYGSRHVWNTVLMEDGWHSVDLTSCDTGRFDEENMTAVVDAAYLDMSATELHRLGYTWLSGSELHPLVK